MPQTLEWYVYHYNVNARQIEKYNVFDHFSFANALNRLPRNKQEFATALQKEAMYYFWAKSEMEVVLCSWPPYIEKAEYDRLTKEVESRKINKQSIRVLNVNPVAETKIDIYEQLMLNWDAFVDYTWNTLNKLAEA